jgi:predicted CopG family antitoxin
MSKLINVSNEVYGRLTELKGGDSYSSIIKELLEKKSNKEKILSFAGKGGVDLEAIKTLKKEWKIWSQKYV